MHEPQTMNVTVLIGAWENTDACMQTARVFALARPTHALSLVSFPYTRFFPFPSVLFRVTCELTETGTWQPGAL